MTADVLGRARTEIAAARHLAEGGFAAQAISRAYYAAFYAAEQALSSLGELRSKHSGVIAAFCGAICRSSNTLGPGTFLEQSEPVATLTGVAGHPQTGSPTLAPQSWKRTLMLSRRCIRLIASAKSGATETTVTFSESLAGWVSIESVTIKRSTGLRSRRSIEPSANTP